MSTAEGYRLLGNLRKNSRLDGDKSHTLSHFLTCLYSGDPHALASAVRNDFDTVASNFKWYHDCCVRLREAGSLRTFLCGSGSTVAALVADQASALEISGVVGGIPTTINTP
jgi:4-diphosphocytidyl-2C-methyl-D-erythritol kinase